MKKYLALLFVLVLATPAFAECTKIQAGTLLDSSSAPLTTGFDRFGYNYQARIFNGLYENFSRPAVPVTEGDENLVMKWSPEWLASVDCNGDGKLDRGLDAKTGVSGTISKGWMTNHFEGDYLGSDGEYHHYTYFVKIAYVGPVVASPDPFASTRIWGQYAIIEELQSDPFGGYGGRLHFINRLTGPGLGQVLP